MNTNKFFNLVMALIFTISLVGMPNSVSAQAPNPIIWGVTASNNWIHGVNWAENTAVQISIDNPSTPQDPDSTTIQNTDANGNFNYQSLYDITVGSVISVTDGFITKQVTVSDFQVLEVDWESDTISGIGTPNASAAIWLLNWWEPFVIDSSGHWQVDLAGKKDITTAPEDQGFAIEQDSDGDGTQSNWSVPRFHAFPGGYANNHIDGFGWPAGSTVTLTVEDPSTMTSPDYSASVIVSNDDPWQTNARFTLQGFELSEGQIVTLTGNSMTKSLVVESLQITEADAASDMIRGTAKPGSVVRLNLWCQNCPFREVIADSNGNWTADFSISGDEAGEVMYDIPAGLQIGALQFDNDNDATRFDLLVPNPQLSARLPDNAIVGYEWLLGSSVTLTIDDPATPEQVDYTDTRTVEIGDWDPNRTQVWFDIDNFLLEPGQVLTMTDGSITKTHTIIDLKTTDVNIDSDTVTGTTNVFTGKLRVNLFGASSNFRTLTPNPDGSWFADFSVPHTSQNKTSDIRPGDVTEASQYDIDGDFTLARWRVPKPNITVYTAENIVKGGDLTKGAQVTLTIDDPTNGIGTDVALEGVADQTGGRCTGWCVEFKMPEDFQLAGGQVITLDDGTTNISYTVSNLKLVHVDIQNDTIRGTADPFSTVDLVMWFRDSQRRVTTDMDGNWIADFSVPGIDPFDRGTCDFSTDPLCAGMAVQFDGNNGGVRIDWRLPNPRIGTWPNDDRIEGWEWPLGATISLEVDDPSTQTNPDFNTNTTVGTAPWDSNQTWFEITLNGYDLKQGDIVTVTDGATIRMITIAELAVTALDLATDTINGTAAPNAEIHVWSDDGSERITTADSLGDWLVDFSVEQNDQPVIDLIFGSTGNVWVRDEDGDQTSVGWEILPPQCQPGDTVTGTVYRKDGTTPIASADLQFEDYDTGDVLFTTTTDQNGQYACSLPAGDYRVSATANNYALEYYAETDLTENAARLHISSDTHLVSINFTLLESFTIEHLTFNLSNPFLQEFAVRQAIALGTNRQRILNNAFLSNGIYGIVSNSIVGSGHWAAAPDSELTVYPYDPAQARDILENAGWIDRDADGYRENLAGNALAFTFKTSNRPFRVASSMIFVDNMADIGIRITPEYYPLGVFLQPRDFDIAEFAWGTTVDDITFINAYISTDPQNYSGYSNPSFDNAMANATAAPSNAEKLPYLIEAQKLISQDLPILPLFTRYSVNPVSIPTGSNITVSPESYLTIHFDHVGLTGQVAVVSTDSSTFSLPQNFQFLGKVYDIGSNAQFTNAQVCFTYHNTGLLPGQEASIRLFHLENNTWTNVTDSGYPNTGNNVVCGTVSSFSPFAIMYANDTIPPTITWVGNISNGHNYYFGFVPSEPTCTASDLSGLDGPCIVKGYATTIGAHTLTATARDMAGNVATETRSYTVTGWTLNGFYQPVDMNGVYNTVKGGSTVPFKFEVFAGSTELTNVADIKSLTYAQTACNANALTDEIETLATGGTSLRYEGGQFIYNWKTPKTTGCYRVTLTTIDGSSLVAYFKLK